MTQDVRSRLLQSFAEANPGLGFGRPSPQPEPTSSFAVTSVARVMQAGGEVAARFMHPTFLPFEKVFRKFPQQGVFTASPQNNFILELGSFRVPQQMAFALVNYRFDLYRLCGAAAGDWVPLEERRLSGQIGYDVVVDSYRKANISYELDPTEIQSAQEAFEPPPSAGTIAAGAEFNNNQPPQIGNFFFPPSAPAFGASATDFANARAAAASSPGGPGLALLPQRHERYGPLEMPFTMMVRENQRVTFKAIVFRPVPIPLAFFEVGVTGLLMPANVAESLLAEMAPYVPQGRP